MIQQDISKLQQNHTDQLAKIDQYKRKFLELSHRVLQVNILLVVTFCMQQLKVISGNSFGSSTATLVTQIQSLLLQVTVQNTTSRLL